MSQLVGHTDDECDDARCPLHMKREFVPITNGNGLGAKECRVCGFKPLHIVGDMCEPCFRKEELDPIVGEWHGLIAKMDECHGRMAESLAKITRSSLSQNFNLHIECQCGVVFNHPMALHKHFPDCPGPKPKAERKKNAARAPKIDVKTFTIG